MTDRSWRTGLNPDLYFKIFYLPEVQVIDSHKIQIRCQKINKKKLKKNFEKKTLDIFLLLIVLKKASRKENLQFLDSPDFENLPDFRTERHVRLSPIPLDKK